ncbi:MAG: response regulator transcription factor [Synergistetes bacterium]|nr:response regulator transcription factor [Synergistota bacterium]
MKKIRVIIADDIADTRRNLKVMLSFSEEIEVVGEAKDGKEVLTLIDKLNPDVVILDINMPQMDGLNVFKAIVGNYPDVKVIAISFQDDKGYKRILERMGISCYLVKPFSISQLIEAVRKAFGER